MLLRLKYKCINQVYCAAHWKIFIDIPLYIALLSLLLYYYSIAILLINTIYH